MYANRLLGGLLAAFLTFGTAPLVATAQEASPIEAQAASLGTISWERLGGATRYDTMREVVARSFSACPWAIVASGENYPDALAASSLAGAINCPVIITEPGGLTAQAASELSRLQVRNVYIVGGEAAVSAAVDGTLASMGITTTRLKGADRQGTSAAVASEILSLVNNKSTAKLADTLFVTTGSDYAGALSISPWAYRAAAPILLADGAGALSPECVNAVAQNANLRRVVLIGDAVSDTAVSQLRQAGMNLTSERISGATTFDINLGVTRWEVNNGFGHTSPVFACGSKYPDALCGAPLAAQSGSVLIMVDDLSDVTWHEIENHYQPVVNAFALGGLAATPLVWSDNAELNQVIDDLFSQRVNILTQNALREAYEYVSTFTYQEGPTYPAGDWKAWSPEKAITMYRTGAGNCYGYASLFTWAARRLGYDAKVISGMTASASQGQVAHSWSEVTIDGVRYVVDPERHHSFLDRDDLNFFLVTYAEAPIYYYDLAGNPYA